MDEKDLLKEVESISEEELSEKEDSKIKKSIVVIGGTLLLLLMFSYVFVTYPISAIIEGKLESELLSEDRLDLDFFSIVFVNESYDILRSLYFKERKVEFSVCLLGEKDNDTYYIDSLYQPMMYEQYFNRVVFDPCSEDTLVILHTHPYKRCSASRADLRMLEKTKERNSDVLMVIMCESERFSVYS